MNTRVLSTHAHGIIDYIEAPTLLAAPALLKLNDVPQSALAARLTGMGGAIYSPATDYELGIVKALPMKGHLALDAAVGGLLAASPWLFGYAKAGRRYWLPHVAVGGFKILAALTTKTQPPYKAAKQ